MTTSTPVSLPTSFAAPPPASKSTATSPSAAATASGGALGSLGNNFNNFLHLLMTQLQNQDPTAPMDTNQFTSQLVQFTSVQQQINTNTALNTLIQATQGGNLLQSASLVGQSVQVSGDQLSLQNGSGTVNIAGAQGQPVNIGVYSSSGVLLNTATITPTAATTSWTWNGKDANGVTQPDGAYKIMAQTPTGTAVPFSTLGTVTGVTRTGTTTNVQLGALSVDLNTVQALGGAAAVQTPTGSAAVQAPSGSAAVQSASGSGKQSASQ